ncbi:MAG: hypothetical protein WBS54_15340 [Acidobacteriota bacterium]
MNPAGFPIVLAFTLLAVAFAVAAVESLSLVRATYWYVAHSCCLIAVYVTYAVAAGNRYLFLWAGLCVVNTWILPFLQGGLKYTAVRVPGEERSSHLATWLLVICLLASLAAVARFSRLTLVVTGSPLDNLGSAFSANLLMALLLFLYGTLILLTHRHLYKLALGLLVMAAGAHLTLVQTAPSFFTMVEIEVLTKVIGTVFAMLYAARLLAERFGSADAARLLRAPD